MEQDLKYETIRTEDSFELRQYKNMLLIKVLVDGPFERAYKSGENYLKEYFEGSNSRGIKYEKPSRYMLKSRPDGWEVACTLPSSMNLENAPRPLNDKIVIEEQRSRPVAVTKFNGKLTYSYLMKKAEELRYWAKTTDLVIGSGPKIVIYRPPFLPFIRRNEIHLDEQS